MTIHRCKHCKEPVRKTIQNIGYCKACIRLASAQPQAKAAKVELEAPLSAFDQLINDILAGSKG